MRCGEDISVHHVFRDRERAASRAAFEAGLSTELVHAEPGITVLRFIEGKLLDDKCRGLASEHLLRHGGNETVLVLVPSADTTITSR